MDTDSALKSEKTATRAESVELAESQTWDMHSTKKLLRKLDWHIIPFMSLIYLLCFLDRTNIGNARLDHLEQDLNLYGIQYNDCLAVLFPFYIAAEIPGSTSPKQLSGLARAVSAKLRRGPSFRGLPLRAGVD
ncbi:high-affinity nicotinic acid transporter [Colletotrichum kahawae]|uniref:High-affinity nicotinic acid transporter n=1 Tax=Colletotrichum kahawae TaxID=34407 RepID=A0AAD9YN71_COLKA|nr:high-affinity nicotinic acid transporter [Colletotrichum kahawae]